MAIDAESIYCETTALLLVPEKTIAHISTDSGPAELRLGGSGVTASEGLKLPPDAVLTIETGPDEEVYGIASSSAGVYAHVLKQG